MASSEVLLPFALWIGVPLVLAGVPLAIWVLRGATAHVPGRSNASRVIAQTEADGTVPPE